MVGHASPQEIARAAAQLLRTCVIERGMGGLAFLIGEHEQPNIRRTMMGTPAFLHFSSLDPLG